MTQLQYTDANAPIDDTMDRPPLEVALLTWEYPPIPTAKGRVACEVAHALAAHGANVRVFTMDRDDVVGTDHERIEVIGCAGRITGLRRLMRKMPGLAHMAAATAFRERVHEEHERRPFDLIEAPNHGAPAAMLMDCGLPIVIRNTSPYALDAVEQTGRGNALNAWVASGMEARCVRDADAIISNTRSHAGMIQDWYTITPGHIHMVTPLSVDPEIRKAGQSAPFPPAHSRLRLAHIGDGSVRKGFAETLLAFDMMVRLVQAEGGPLPELHLIGLHEGGLAEHIEAFDLTGETQEQIFDHGRLTDSEMSHVISRCHGVMAPSRYQSSGSVYREAAAFGRPLVACAENPLARDFVGRFECGILAETCSPEDIAKATLDLFSDREKLMACRTAALAYAQTWTRQTLGARTLQIYRRAMRLEPIDIPGMQPAPAGPRHRIRNYAA
ncbi:glycosyltransferase family 4 protein [Henriciella aquimarina]|uniref:glycosyltransferase family 4 protein n=1 Tax=Henriciella aquimarina TaxID=545261 RepID=UPI000A03C791|nr:glycosyltransferase family 4 protein [Henriciella aquimarina]